MDRETKNKSIKRGNTNDLNDMWTICHDCAYWEVCEPPYICSETEQKYRNKLPEQKYRNKLPFNVEANYV